MSVVQTKINIFFSKEDLFSSVHGNMSRVVQNALFNNQLIYTNGFGDGVFQSHKIQELAFCYFFSGKTSLKTWTGKPSRILPIFFQRTMKQLFGRRWTKSLRKYFFNSVDFSCLVIFSQGVNPVGALTRNPSLFLQIKIPNNLMLRKTKTK